MAPGPAGHETDAGPAGGLADGFRHHRGAAFLTADGERDRAVVECVEGGEIALARHAEGMVDTVSDKLIDEDFASGSRSVIAAHDVSLISITLGTSRHAHACCGHDDLVHEEKGADIPVSE